MYCPRCGKNIYKKPATEFVCEITNEIFIEIRKKIRGNPKKKSPENDIWVDYQCERCFTEFKLLVADKK